MMDAATTRGYGGVLLHHNTLYYFGGLWPDYIRLHKVIPIFVLEAITVVIGAFTFAEFLHNKKVILRCDSSNSCGTTDHPSGALNTLKSKNPALQYVADLWSDCQQAVGFDGLVFFCPGEHNTWADHASRSEPHHVENDLRVELYKIERGDVTIQRVDTVWSVGNASADVLQHLFDICKKQKIDLLQRRLTLPL